MGERAVSVARIVVGVDGSGPSEDALRWAARQAALTGAVVEAVTVWEYPMWYGTSALAAGFDFADNAAKILAQALDETFGTDRPVEIRSRVEQGNPAGVLLAASRGRSCWWWGTGGTAGSPRRCWGRSASTSFSTRSARWSSSAAPYRAPPMGPTACGEAMWPYDARGLPGDCGKRTRPERRSREEG